MTPEKEKLLSWEWRQVDDDGGGEVMLMKSSLQRHAVINTGRTLGVLALTTSSWTTSHQPKEWLSAFANTVQDAINYKSHDIAQ